MAKIGRNEPCPCGSGKKYKRCCLKTRGQSDSRSSVVESPTTPWPNVPGLPADVKISAYAMAKMLQESDILANMKKKDPARAALFWTPDRVAALDTEQLLDKLGTLGIFTSPAIFVERAAACPTAEAWSLSTTWRDDLEAAGTLSRFDDDLLGLAACELWKRWCPERPSREMLDDWMQEGYDLSRAGEGEAACERWWSVWQPLRDRMKPEMRTCEEAEPLLRGIQAIFNWVQDFTMELHNAAIDQRRFAAIGEQLCREVLAQFTDEDDLFELNLRSDLGEFLYLDERPDEGEAVLLKMIEDHPDEPAGYTQLASILGYGPRGRRGGGALDLPRAITLLEQAIARPVRRAEGWDLQARLDDLRKELPKIDELVGEPPDHASGPEAP